MDTNFGEFKFKLRSEFDGVVLDLMEERFKSYDIVLKSFNKFFDQDELIDKLEMKAD